MIETDSVVVFFSKDGHCKSVANALAKLTNSAIVEILPSVAYTPEDFDYENPNSRGMREMRDTKACPPIRENIPDGMPFHTVYMVYPIWWGSFPRPVHTFCKQWNWENKQVVPICVSGGSGFALSLQDMKEWTKGSILKPGIEISSAQMENVEEILQQFLQNQNMRP